MSDDDDWETDADFVNDLTEEQKRAFGNKETMQKYNATMGRGSLTAPPGSSQFEPATREAPHAIPPTPHFFRDFFDVFAVACRYHHRSVAVCFGSHHFFAQTADG